MTPAPRAWRALKRGGRALRAVSDRLARVNPAPVFIYGHPKSGTTAIAALLAERTRCSVTLDIPALFGDKVFPIRDGERDMRRVVRENRRAFSRDIVKQPSLTFLAVQLRKRFPGARHVVVVRDPRDNIRSILDRLDLPGDLADIDAAHRARLPPAWDAVFDAARLGVDPGTYIEVVARRWCLAADAYLDYRDEALLVRYEDFQADRGREIDVLAEKLGLPARADISGRLARQFQPAGAHRGIDPVEFFGTENLARIERVCRSRMMQLGY